MHLEVSVIRTVLLALLVLSTLDGAQAASATDPPPEQTNTVSLADLARQADLIALVQVRDTDYLYQREFPVAGSAFLQVLIPYKIVEPGELIEVHEKGLDGHTCYFPNPTVFEEGRRYLVFLRHDPEKPERFKGLSAGCALDVLVGKDNSYIVRLPAMGIALADRLDTHRQIIEFADAYAVETGESLNPELRDELLKAGWIVQRGEDFAYTSGVPLATVRGLMEIEGTPEDRQ
jgi:hypothetical protein